MTQPGKTKTEPSVIIYERVFSVAYDSNRVMNSTRLESYATGNGQLLDRDAFLGEMIDAAQERLDKRRGDEKHSLRPNRRIGEVAEILVFRADDQRDGLAVVHSQIELDVGLLGAKLVLAARAARIGGEAIGLQLGDVFDQLSDFVAIELEFLQVGLVGPCLVLGMLLEGERTQLERRSHRQADLLDL